MKQVPDLTNLNSPDDMRAGRPPPGAVGSARSQELRPARGFLWRLILGRCINVGAWTEM